MTAELLADRAAAEALTQPNLSAGQWIYQVQEWSTHLPGPQRPGANGIHMQSGWMTADGTITYGGAGIIGNPIFPYDKIGSLPRDPAKLNTYFRSQDPVKSDNNSSVEFGQIREMLFGMVPPPWLEAEMFHALALIPMVRVQDHVKDIAGRPGVAFVLPPTKQSEKQEIILDASDYRLLGDGTWTNPSTASPDVETAILKEYPVAELGSTQQAVARPSKRRRRSTSMRSTRTTRRRSAPSSPASGCTGRCAPAERHRRSGRPPTTPPRLRMCTASFRCASAPRPARRRSSG
jgi:hypothetical protein